MKTKKILLSLACFGLFAATALSTGAKEETMIQTESDLHFMTAEESAELFGSLPQYLDLGSFWANIQNHIPLPSFEDQYMIITDKDGNEYISRPTWQALEAKITEMITPCQGDWAVYVKDLKNDTVISINNHPMESASLIKLYIAGTTLEKIENGELTETDTIKNALRQMIIVSDNESSNILVRSFYADQEGASFQDGLDMVNDFNERHGYKDTSQVNGIADPSLWVSDGRINETSVEDCGKILEDIYNRELVSHYASYRFEYLLNNQEVNYKIPKGLPEGVHISHKTGEVDDTENDAAIIYTPYGDYILCIMSTDLYNTGDAVDMIHKITKTVHTWFTSPLTVIPAEETEESETETASAAQ